MFSEQDYHFMAKAVQLAKTPLFSPHPNPRVGCVIVKNGVLIGQGYHAYAGGPHAEANALSSALTSVSGDVKDATVYVTLEPCSHHGKTPPCADALVNAGVKRVVIAMVDPNPKVSGQGVERLRSAGVAVETGLMEAQAALLNRGFIKRMKQGLPWVRSKIAISLDGRTAMANGESQWITSQQARADVQKLRARSDAILTGVGTVLADNPRLTVRDLDDARGKLRQPLRVVVDSQLRIHEQAKILQESGETWIATINREMNKSFPANATVQQFSNKGGTVDLNELLSRLAAHEISEVHVEAGSQLNGCLLSEQLIDELIVYMAPVVMGDTARGMFHLPNLKQMQDRVHFSIADFRMVGQDVRVTFTPQYRNP